MKTKDELFTEKLKEFEGLIHYASHRMSISGVVDKEDSFQEALIILSSMFDKYEGIESLPVDFRKLFKTELWHGLSKLVNFHRTQKRDWKKVLRSSESNVHGNFSILEMFEQHTFKQPDELGVEEHEAIADEFLDHLICRINEDQSILLFEILHPRDLPEEMKKQYKRVPSRPSLWMLSQYLDWTVHKVRSTLYDLRSSTAILAEEYGFGDYSNRVRA